MLAFKVDGSNTTGQSGHVSIDPQLAKTEALALWLTAAAAIAVVAFATYSYGGVSVWIVFAMSIALFLAMGALGAVLGFIFAVPRVARELAVSGAAPEVAANVAQAKRTRLSTNTNLEDISDWLSKMFVGIGLVQLGYIKQILADFGGVFDNMFPKVLGAGVFFCCLGTFSLLIGFLFFYVQTRTRTALLFDLVERLKGIDDAATQQSKTADQFARSPLNPDSGPVREFAANPSTPIPADRTILAAGFDSLSSSEEFAAWAAAKARQGEFLAAAAGWQEAIKRDEKNKPELRKGLAEVLFALKRPREAMAALREAIAAAPAGSDEQLQLKRSALFFALYLGEPDSFTEAQPIVDALLASPKFAEDPWVRLWSIAALGRKARWLRQTRGAGADLSDIKATVIEQIDALKRMAPDRNSPPREFLRKIIDPSGAGGDETEDDLIEFANDPEVRAATDE